MGDQFLGNLFGAIGYIGVPFTRNAGYAVGTLADQLRQEIARQQSAEQTAMELLNDWMSSDVFSGLSSEATTPKKLRNRDFAAKVAAPVWLAARLVTLGQIGRNDG